MAEFKIEKNVPMPPPGMPRNKYPFSIMEIGDSILGDRKTQRAAQQWGRTNARKFTSREEGDGYRVWRIA